MRFSKPMIILLTACAIISCSTVAIGADKITLTSGEVVEGKIVSETDTHMRIEVPMNESGSIFKSRTVPRAEIKSIAQRSADEMLDEEMESAYKNTQKYRLKSASSYTVDYYEKTITGVFSNFVMNYPESPHVSEIEAEIAKWQEERNIVATGKVKHNGGWITGKEAALVASVGRVEEMAEESEKLLTAKDYTNAIARAAMLDKETLSLVGSCTGTARHADALDLRIRSYRFWCSALEGRDKQIQGEMVLNKKHVVLCEQRAVKAKGELDRFSVGKDSSSDTSRRKRNECMQVMVKERNASIEYKRHGVELKAEQIRLKAQILEIRAAYEQLKKE